MELNPSLKYNASVAPQIIIGLDYELYFGKRTGSIENCLLRPTQTIRLALESAGAKLTLFVDAGCLISLRKESNRAEDYHRICTQLKSLFDSGHDIQLHIHPHWQDSHFTESDCQLDTNRYRLHDFSVSDVEEIVRDYKFELENIIEAPVFAYRAGGWCIQPFTHIQNALRNNGILVDSTVYSGGYSSDTGREFDFTNAPATWQWRFSVDPGVPDPNGVFSELPITPVKSTPLFYIESEFRKRLWKKQHQTYGDGAYIQHDISYYQDRLLSRSIAPASIDGFKSSMLPRALKWARENQSPILNIMGHPKALSKWGVQNLIKFIKNNALAGTTFRSVYSN